MRKLSAGQSDDVPLPWPLPFSLGLLAGCKTGRIPVQVPLDASRRAHSCLQGLGIQ
jgi:hypothetical protein